MIGRRAGNMIRDEFPVLSRVEKGKPIVYLDNAATTQKPNLVIDTITRFYRNENATIHRGIYELSEKATEAYTEAHRKVARLIGADSERSIIFTRNATEALNLIASAWGREHISSGDEILITLMAHHSDIVPWLQLAKEKGAKVIWAEITDTGELDLRDLKRKITKTTKIVSVMHCSNVLGSINPVSEIGKWAHEVDALFVVDGAQSAPHLPIDVKEMDCDFFAFSGHKMFGPTGIGVLYGKEEILQHMEPYVVGGDMISEVHLDHAKWNELPWKYEAGTSNIAGGIGLGAAVDYIQSIGWETILQQERELCRYAYSKLEAIEDIIFYGPPKEKERVPLISFNLKGLHPHDLATALAEEGICVRAGHHCTQPLMRRLGVAATTRVSFAPYNTTEEIDRLAEALEKSRKFFSYAVS